MEESKTKITSFFKKQKSEKNRNTNVTKMKTITNTPSIPPTLSRFGICPICQNHFPIHILYRHAEACIEVRTMSNRKNNDDEHPYEHPQGMCEFDGMNESKNSALDAKLDRSFVEKKNLADNNECKRKRMDKDINITDSIYNENNPCWWKRPKPNQTIKTRNIPTSEIINARENKSTTDIHCIEHISEPIPGLFIYNDFITEEEEKYILSCLDNDTDHVFNQTIPKTVTTNHNRNPWKKNYFNGPHFGKRWGVHCNLRDKKVSAPQHPLPHFLTDLILPRLKQLDIFKSSNAVSRISIIHPNEANAIDYHKKLGHYLSSHVDDRQMSKEPIFNLSLAGDCYMTYKNTKRNTKVYSSKLQSTETEQKVLLPRRTLQVMTGKSRYDYSHGIRNSHLISDRRVSLTIRESPRTT